MEKKMKFVGMTAQFTKPRFVKFDLNQEGIIKREKYKNRCKHHE